MTKIVLEMPKRTVRDRLWDLQWALRWWVYEAHRQGRSRGRP